MLLLIHFRFVNSNSPSPGMGELNIYPPGGDLRGQPTAGTAQDKKVPMVQIYIYVFLKIADLKSL